MLAITIASIIGITCLAWLMGRVLPFRVCPICAGVAGTWLWMLGLLLLGYDIDRIIIALLMGGSVVGIAYQLEKKLPVGKALLWKAFFIPIGFVAAYSVVTLQWILLVGSVSIIGIVAWIFMNGRAQKVQSTQKVEALKKSMENCC